MSDDTRKPSSTDPYVSAAERLPKQPAIASKTPTVGHDGVPMCSRMACPKYRKYTDQCAEMPALDEVSDVCIPAVQDMVLEIDARRDAADPAFDEIVKLCGLAETWEYPAQVVRDVEDALKKRDETIAQLREMLDRMHGHEPSVVVGGYAADLKKANERVAFLDSEQIRLMRERDDKTIQLRSLEDSLKVLLESIDEEHRHEGALAGAEATIGRLREDLAKQIQTSTLLRACVVYARDRRGGSFDFDEWISMVDKALVGVPLAHAIENAQANEARAWEAVANMRKDRDATRAELRDLKTRIADAEHSLNSKDATWLRSAWEAEIQRNEELQRRVADVTSERDDLREGEAAYQEIIMATGITRASIMASFARERAAPHEKLRIAEAVRDDARAASARDLVTRRDALTTLSDAQKTFDEIKAQRDAALQRIAQQPDAIRELRILITSMQSPMWQKPSDTKLKQWLADIDRVAIPAMVAPPAGYDRASEPARMNTSTINIVDSGKPDRCPKCGRTENDQHRCSQCFEWGCECPGHFKEDSSTDPNQIAENKRALQALGYSEPDADELSRPAPAWARPGLSSEQIRDAIIAEVGMMADARTPAMQAAYDDALAREGKKDSPDGPRSATQCSCSPMYLELAPGVHSTYCALAGQPLDDGMQRWRCRGCSATYRHKLDKCIDHKCGGDVAEVT